MTHSSPWYVFPLVGYKSINPTLFNYRYVSCGLWLVDIDSLFSSSITRRWSSLSFEDFIIILKIFYLKQILYIILIFFDGLNIRWHSFLGTLYLENFDIVLYDSLQLSDLVSQFPANGSQILTKENAAELARKYQNLSYYKRYSIFPKYPKEWSMKKCVV